MMKALNEKVEIMAKTIKEKDAIIEK